MRNILDHIGRNDKARVAEKLIQIWNRPDRNTALHSTAMFMEKFADLFPKVVETL
jgi:transposase-like protein